MADTLTVEIKGLEQLQHKFNVADDVVRRESHDAMESAVVVVHDRAATYPAQRPCDYIRTGNLGRMFHHEVHHLAHGVQGLVKNAIPYGPYVKGAEAQAWMHKGFWPTVKDDVNAERDRIEAFFAKALENLARFLGD